MTPTEIEQKIFDLEEIRVVIRAQSNTKLGNYNFDRKAAINASISEWLSSRVYPILDGNEIVVVDGTGAIPHGRTKLAKLRESYE
jgi:hypothetical protein